MEEYVSRLQNDLTSLPERKGTRSQVLRREKPAARSLAEIAYRDTSAPGSVLEISREGTPAFERRIQSRFSTDSSSASQEASPALTHGTQARGSSDPEKVAREDSPTLPQGIQRLSIGDSNELSQGTNPASASTRGLRGGCSGHSNPASREPSPAPDQSNHNHNTSNERFTDSELSAIEILSAGLFEKEIVNCLNSFYDLSTVQERFPTSPQVDSVHAMSTDNYDWFHDWLIDMSAHYETSREEVDATYEDNYDWAILVCNDLNEVAVTNAKIERFVELGFELEGDVREDLEYVQSNVRNLHGEVSMLKGETPRPQYQGPGHGLRGGCSGHFNKPSREAIPAPGGSTDVGGKPMTEADPSAIESPKKSKKNSKKKTSKKAAKGPFEKAVTSCDDTFYNISGLHQNFPNFPEIDSVHEMVMENAEKFRCWLADLKEHLECFTSDLDARLKDFPEKVALMLDLLEYIEAENIGIGVFVETRASTLEGRLRDSLENVEKHIISLAGALNSLREQDSRPRATLSETDPLQWIEDMRSSPSGKPDSRKVSPTPAQGIQGGSSGGNSSKKPARAADKAPAQNIQSSGSSASNKAAQEAAPGTAWQGQYWGSVKARFDAMTVSAGDTVPHSNIFEGANRPPDPIIPGVVIMPDGSKKWTNDTWAMFRQDPECYFRTRQSIDELAMARELAIEEREESERWAKANEGQKESRED